MRDPKTTLPPTAILRPVPAWARVKTAPASATDAAFAAGAALAALDAIVRAERVFAGVWRQRLALSAAARMRLRCAIPGVSAPAARIQVPPTKQQAQIGLDATAS